MLIINRKINRIKNKVIRQDKFFKIVDLIYFMKQTRKMNLLNQKITTYHKLSKMRMKLLKLILFLL
jgi:hypothetical protein